MHIENNIVRLRFILGGPSVESPTGEHPRHCIRFIHLQIHTFDAAVVANSSVVDGDSGIKHIFDHCIYREK